jgi:plasmid stabilization system protein ParE
VSQPIRYAPWFDADVQLRTARYAEQAGPKVANRFVDALQATVTKLANNPCRGHPAYPKDPDLADLRVIQLVRPFQKYLLYYRIVGEMLILERLIYGGRDLPRRLRESPHERD